MNSNPNQPVFLIPSNVQRPPNISNPSPSSLSSNLTSSLPSNLTSQSPRHVQQQMTFANGTKKITILTSTPSNIPRGATTRIIRNVEGMALPMKTQIPIVTKTSQIPIMTTTGSRMPIRLVPMTSIPNIQPQQGAYVSTVQQSPRTLSNVQTNAIPEGVRVALISSKANSLSPKSARPTLTSTRMISIPVQEPVSHPKVIAFNPQASKVPQPPPSSSGHIRTVYIAKESLQYNGSSSTRMTSSRPSLIPMTSTGPTMTSGMTPTMTHTVTPTMTPAMSTLTPTPTMKTQTDSAKILTPDEFNFKMAEVQEPHFIPKLDNDSGTTVNSSISFPISNEKELSNQAENEPIARKKPRKQIMNSPPLSVKSTPNADQDQILEENDEEMKDMEVEHEIIKPFLEKIHDLKKLDAEVPLEPNYIENQPQMSLKKRYVCFLFS